jgi:membrane-bound ClpP family serine protease
MDATESRAESAVIFELGTPGGLDESMHDILERVPASDVPLIV